MLMGTPRPQAGGRRVAIIGAGASGLAALKECLAADAAGLAGGEGGAFAQVVCFEQAAQLGGLWSATTKGSAGPTRPSPIYQSAVINTSKQMLGYSDFPVPEDWPTFLPHQLVHRYLEMYAEYFGLLRHIRFGRKVLAVRPVLALDHPPDALAGDSSSNSPSSSSARHTGQWEVTYQRVGMQNSSAQQAEAVPADSIRRPQPTPKTVRFDHVIVANGHHWKPNPPSFPGLEEFAGTKLHSHRYKMPYAFKDQTVLIIGAGNSGLDIATELSHHASKVYLSTRTGAWVFPRATLFGLPTDFLNSRAFSALPRTLVNGALESLVSLYHGGTLPAAGLQPQHRVLEAAPAVNGEIFARIHSGKVVVKPNVDRFGPHTVTFQDGSEEHVDTVIYCTGYAIEHPFLEPRVLGKEKPGDRLQLYKHVFSLAYRHIAFVGLVQPFGSIFPVAEMQSRWIARVFAGASTLPEVARMRDAVDAAWAAHIRLYLPRERHILQVDYVTYLDDLAVEVGCMPDLWSLWRRNWTLACQVTFGPALPQHYRLHGPGNRRDEAEAIISAVCLGSKGGSTSRTTKPAAPR